MVNVGAAIDVTRAARAARPAVIVGLGSTGSALAARLSKLGHNVVALERYAGTVQGRIYDVAPSTIDMLKHWDMADDVLRGAVTERAGAAIAGNAKRATTDLGALIDGIDGADPRAWLNISKSSVDTALRDVATRNGAKLMTGTAFTRAEYAKDGVRVFTSGSEKPIEGSMLIFADGGKDASKAALGFNSTTFPEKARYIGQRIRTAGDAGSDAAQGARELVNRPSQGFAYHVPGTDEALVWARVPEGGGELATSAARDFRDSEKLAASATKHVQASAAKLGAPGEAVGAPSIADVQMRLSDGVVDSNGAIGLGDLVAGVPFDHSQGFNAGILQAERAAQHVQASLVPGADRAALVSSYQNDILDGARRLVDHSRRAVGGGA